VISGHKRTGAKRMKSKSGFWLLTTFLLTTIVPAQAQQPTKVQRVGVLTSGGGTSGTFQREAFRRGLSELGYVEGKNITIEYRSAEGKYDRLPDLAAELVRLKVDVILAQSTPAVAAAKNATTTIPIVIAGGSDPVATGLVASLARPGGNITGITIMNAETAGRRLELLKEAGAKVSRVTILGNSTNPGAALVFKQTQSAAQDLGLQIQSLDVKSVSDLEGAFKAATRGGATALVLLASVPVSNHLRQIADFAVKNRLASIYDRSDFAEAGGLMSYGTHLPEMFRRSLTYVDKILKGAKPADLPVEQPMKFELVINLKTAKQIGLTIPQSVLYRADKVIK
jgi:putative tryptophan/tyrosine transport system substrate-binding protein